MENVKEFLKNAKVTGVTTNLSVDQYRAYDKFTDGIYYAWDNRDDETTKPFWGAEEKPEKPTDSFVEDYINNADEETELQSIKEAFDL